MQTAPTAERERPHRNHGLFSDPYLDATLPTRPGWEELVEKSKPAMEAVADVFASYTPSTNEAQTEEELVRPVLRILGHEGTFEVQPTLATPDGTKRPDYVLYRDAASLARNKNLTLTDELLRGGPGSGGAFAVGDAKYWDRPLDASLKGKGDPFSNKNAYQHKGEGAVHRPAYRGRRRAARAGEGLTRKRSWC